METLHHSQKITGDSQRITFAKKKNTGYCTHSMRLMTPKLFICLNQLGPEQS